MEQHPLFREAGRSIEKKKRKKTEIDLSSQLKLFKNLKRPDREKKKNAQETEKEENIHKKEENSTPINFEKTLPLFDIIFFLFLIKSFSQNL